MKYIKLFEDFAQSLDEGQIQVYKQGNPWKQASSMQWTHAAEHVKGYAETEDGGGRGIVIGADFDYDKFIADPEYKSIPLGTWNDKSLPKFLDKHPGYDEIEFDYVEVLPNPEKEREPWVKIADKDGIEFMIPPFLMIDVHKGGSVKYGIVSGEHFLVNKMRATITDFKNGKIHVTLQNGDKEEYTVSEWKAKNFLALEEKEKA